MANPASLPSYLQRAAYQHKVEKIRRRVSYWQPDPRNQPQCLAYELALHSEVMEIGYGGQAGGGKTDLILGLASRFRQASILRREFAQMDGIIERGNEIYPVSFVEGTKKAWRFDGRVIKLGYMNRDADWKKHQGRARDFLGIDEAAEFTEKGIRSVMGWVRAEPGRRTLVVMCFNPPTTPEGEWIVKYFAPWIDPEYPGDRAASGEIRWMAHVRDEGGSEKVIEAPDGRHPFEYNGQTIYPVSRTFIQASRYDNPYLDEDYERRLDNLPEPLRTIVKEGDFTTIGRQDDAWQVIPTAWVLAAQARWRAGARPNVALRALGADIARGGEDKTAIAPLYGTWFDPIRTYPGTQTHDGQTAARVILDNHDGQAPIYIDVIGVGASAYDQLKHQAKALPINNAESSGLTDSSGKFGFANLRAQAYWKLREALDPLSGENIALPDDRELRVELCAPRYKIVGGKYQIEPKDDLKKRLGRSPDKADAVALAWMTTHYLQMQLWI